MLAPVLVLWDDRPVQDEGGRSGSAPSQARVRQWRRLLADEREAALVYRDLALRREGEEREPHGEHGRKAGGGLKQSRTSPSRARGLSGSGMEPPF